MIETQFQDAVVELAHRFGWMVFHARPARTNHGWRTPVAYDGQGFPDCVMVNPKQRLTLFVEFKTDTGRLSPAQEAWGTALAVATVNNTDCRYKVWRPAQANDIARTLTKGKVTEWRLTA